MSDVAPATTPVPAQPTLPPLVVTPGVSTTEHVMSYVAIILTALFGAGVIPTAGPVQQVAVIAAIVLTSLGYTVARTTLKAQA